MIPAWLPPASPASPVPEPYSVEAATREAVEALWDTYGWDRECCIPSVEDVIDHMRPYIADAMRRGAESATLRGAA